MQDPRKLRVRDEARVLAIATYKLTEDFPPHERFGLTAQMRRAAVSVGSNIAEGCGRQGDRSMLAYVHQAVGSLDELEFQIELSTELGYCRAETAGAVCEHLRATRRMLVSLILALRKRLGRRESN